MEILIIPPDGISWRSTLNKNCRKQVENLWSDPLTVKSVLPYTEPHKGTEWCITLLGLLEKGKSLYMAEYQFSSTYIYGAAGFVLKVLRCGKNAIYINIVCEVCINLPIL